MSTPYAEQNRLYLTMLIVASFVVSALFFFDKFLYLAACPLCLIQRPSWYALLLLIPLTLFTRAKVFHRLLCALMAGTILVSMGYAVFQAGAEWSWWSGLHGCSNMWQAFAELFVTPQLDRLPDLVPCDQKAWRLFGLSLAGYNVLASLAELVLISTIVVRAERS